MSTIFLIREALTSKLHKDDRFDAVTMAAGFGFMLDLCLFFMTASIVEAISGFNIVQALFM